jgi:hypothetical protein
MNTMYIICECPNIRSQIQCYNTMIVIDDQQPMFRLKSQVFKGINKGIKMLRSSSEYNTATYFKYGIFSFPTKQL